MTVRFPFLCLATLLVLNAGHATEDSLQARLDAADPGATVRIPSGLYRIDQPLIVDKPLVIEGDGAILDAAYRCELMTVSAKATGSRIHGLTFRNGGRSSTREWAGIRIDGAERIAVEDCQFIDCNYGIYLAKANEVTLSGNRIKGQPGLEQNSGNGIHLWNCRRISIDGNEINGHRDGIYLEFTKDSHVEGNRVADNMRYGMHFMSSNDCRYLGNRFTANGAGVAVMYSSRVEMRGNVFEKSWGGSSYGLLLKDIRDSHIAENQFLHNSTAIYAQGVNRTRFEGNLLRENGWALRLLSDGLDNVIRENNFIRNSFDVAVNGTLTNHQVEANYWDRYEGYDLGRDGVGDVPYRPVSLYGMLTERVPASLMLLHSFLVQLLDRAERAFPSITPENVVDPTPAAKPNHRAVFSRDSQPNPSTP